MFWYMGEKAAFNAGFTHHGKYFGIPIWISLDEDAPMVSAKWRPMDVLMEVAHVLEGLMHSLLHPDVEPVFQFAVGRKISV